MTQQTPSVEAAAQNLVGKQNLNVLLVDSGGRGHAIAWQIANIPSELVGLDKLLVAPGNPGTAAEGDKVENRDVSPTDIDELVRLAVRESVDLVMPPMDDTLAAGLVDRLAEVDIPAFGPTKAAARIEASKIWAKELMVAAGIPTALYEKFDDAATALTYIDGVSPEAYPLVVKDDGLAQGKGVAICETPEKARKAIQQMRGKFLIEEYLDGQEISLHAVCALDENGKPVYKMFPASQDHKQLEEGDQGPNTGGMGTIAPLEWFGQEMVEAAGKIVVEPLLKKMVEVDTPFIGVLYPGVKLTSKGIKVLEYNARPGDPETEVYMRLLETSMLDIAVAALTHRLGELELKWREGAAACIINAAPGYPGDYTKGLPITGVKAANADEGVKVYQAGTKETKEGRRLVSAGGRVLGVTAVGRTLGEALARAYAASSKIGMPGKRVRRDIGQRPIPEVVGLDV